MSKLLANIRRSRGQLKVVGFAALTVASILITNLVDSRYFGPDTAQYLSTAENIAEGDGIATDVIYYELQHGIGTIPAQQTIWPPGYPLLIALFALVGGSVDSAAVFINFMSVGVILWLSIEFMKLLQVPPPWRYLPAVLVSIFQPLWGNVIAGLSAPVAIVFGLASTYCYLKYESQSEFAHLRTYWLMFSGAMAGLSFAITFVFAFYVLGLWATSALRMFGSGYRNVFRDTTILVLSASLFVVPILLRNTFVANSLSSRPSGIENVSLVGGIKQVAIGIANLIGVSPDRPVLSVVVVTSIVLLGIYVLATIYRTKERSAVVKSLMLPIVFCAVLPVGILALATLSDGYTISKRYIAYSAPWLFILLACIVSRAMTDRSVRSKHLLIVLLTIAMVGQLGLFSNMVQSYEPIAIRKKIDQAMQVDIGEEKLIAMLEREISDDRPLLVNDPQNLWLKVRRPMVGLPERKFSMTNWESDRVKQLVRQFGIQYVLFLPGIVDGSIESLSNQPFFADMINVGHTTEWLKPVYVDEQVILYEVQDR